MSFPSTGELSMQTIRNALNLGSGQISMSDLYGKRLYNTDGSVVTLPSSGQIDISQFRGKFYTAPVIAPVTVLYRSPTNTETTISIPTGKTRLPSSFDVKLYGGGGAGGGGGGAGAASFPPTKRSGAGGGGGGSGGYTESAGYVYSSQTIKIYVGGGAPRVNGGAGVGLSAGNGSNGANGTKGGDSYITINGITETTAVGGNGGTGGQGGRNPVAQGQPGGSGGTGSIIGNAGSSGSIGVNTSLNAAIGGNGGTGGSSVDATGYGKGGNGGKGGANSTTNAFAGYYTPITADNATYNSEAGTDGAVEITWYYNS